MTCSADLKELNRINKKIILCVGAINQSIKRTDFVVNEISKLNGDFILLLCGEVMDPWIVQNGKDLLGDRLIVLTVPPESMDEVYRYSDILVFASINEGFGYCIIEAMANKLPVLVHDNDRNKWIVKDEEQCVDMLSEGILSEKLIEIFSDDQWRKDKSQNNYYVYNNNYRWDSVKSKYIDIIETK